MIDEAGMADTISLDAAVQYIVECGGGVRLVDDQQLAAIGAGGVTPRPLRPHHGALRLTELLQFTGGPAEGFASLALRDGRPEALDFYLDSGASTSGTSPPSPRMFSPAWQADRAAAWMRSMLAPPASSSVSSTSMPAPSSPPSQSRTGRKPRGWRCWLMATGQCRRAGDHRTNNRTLRLTATDWVKSRPVDRLQGGRSGELTVRHSLNGRTVRRRRLRRRVG